MSKTVKFNIDIKIDGKSHLATLAIDAKEVGKALGQVQKQAKGVQGTIQNIANISVLAGNVRTALQGVASECKVLTDAYQLQLESETKLETVMRQRMAASAQDVQAMKDLASAQQQVGIIGDEVTLMGMQQLATFVNQRQTLEQLTPAMLNLLAQQKGFNATAGDSVAIANLFGKAMQGNASALTRVGITMSEAQKEALKNGNEMERASMLAQIITENVGNMNEQLAQTDAGKAKQIANAFGDWQEQIGAMIMPFQTLITQIGSLGTAANTFVMLGSGVGAAVKSLWNLSNAGKMAAVNQKLATAAAGVLQKALTAMGISAVVGEKGIKALTWAVRGLEIATGIRAAIAALSIACDALGIASSKAGDETKALGKEMTPLQQNLQNARQAGQDWLATANVQIAKLKQLVDGHRDDKNMVAELNSQYGAIFGSYSTAAQWYDVLTRKSAAYCDQLIAEAEAKALANQIVEIRQQKRDALKKFNQGVLNGTYLVDKAAINPLDGKPYRVNDQSPIKMDMKGNPLPINKAPYLNPAGMLVYKGMIQAYDRQEQEARAQMDKSLKTAAAAQAKVGAAAPPKRGGGGGVSRSGGGGASAVKTEPAKVDFEQWEFVSEDQQLQESLDKAIEQILLADLMRRNFDVVMADKIKRIKDALGKTQNSEQKKELQGLLEKAEAEQAAGVEPWENAYNDSLEKFKDLRGAIEPRLREIEIFRAGLDKPLGEPRTLKDFEDWLTYLNALAPLAEGDALKQINTEISKFTEAKEALERASAPAPEVDRLAPTMSQLDTAIQFYTEQQQYADAEQILKLQMTIGMLTKKRNTIAFVTEFPDIQQKFVKLQNLTGKELKIELNAIGFDEIESRIKHLQDILSEAGGLLPEWMGEGVAEMIDGYKKLQTQVGKTNGEAGNTAGIASAASAIDGLSQAIARTSEENKGLAASMTVVSAAASIAQLIAGFVSKLNSGTVSIWDYIAAAATGTATIVGCATQLKGIGAFADGGVVSGPTLALVGEYAGATNNPEVIAPLSKLQSMIQIEQGASGGKVEFEIKERKLRGVLRKGAKYNSRR